MTGRKDVSPITLASSRLELIGVDPNDDPFSFATGFFYRSKNAVYLCTNRHVFTGRHDENGEWLDKKSQAFPSNVKLRLFAMPPTSSDGTLSEDGPPAEGSDVQRMFWNFTLNSTEAHKGYFCPRDFGLSYDIALVPAPRELGSRIMCANDLPAETPMFVGPADNVIVAGFPRGRSAGWDLPVWLSGTVASEPTLGYEEQPIFLIDCATTPGCSGSPVFAYSATGTYRSAAGTVGMTAGKPNHFLGIYSGRMQDNLTIGRVWQTQAIAEFADLIEKNATDYA